MEAPVIDVPFSRKGRSFEAVAAGQTATAKIVPSNTLRAARIIYSGVTLAQMTEIRLVVNGDVIRRYRGGDELNRENQFLGRAAAAGTLIFDMERYHQLADAGRQLTSLGMGLADSARFIANTVEIEIDIDAAAAGPVLRLGLDLTLPGRTGEVLHRRIRNLSADGSGEQEFNDLLLGGEQVYMMEFASQRMTDLKIERNNSVAFERSRADNRQIQVDEGLNPGALLFDGANESYCYFPGERSNIGGLFLSGAGDDIVFKPTFSAAEANFRVAITTIAPLKQ